MLHGVVHSETARMGYSDPVLLGEAFVLLHKVELLAGAVDRAFVALRYALLLGAGAPLQEALEIARVHPRPGLFVRRETDGAPGGAAPASLSVVEASAHGTLMERPSDIRIRGHRGGRLWEIFWVPNHGTPIRIWMLRDRPVDFTEEGARTFVRHVMRDLPLHVHGHTCALLGGWRMFGFSACELGDVLCLTTGRWEFRYTAPGPCFEAHLDSGHGHFPIRLNGEPLRPGFVELNTHSELADGRFRTPGIPGEDTWRTFRELWELEANNTD